MNKIIIITGTGRSGTSWLHDVTTSHYNYRGIFEPLHPSQAEISKGLSGICLDEDDKHDDLKDYLDKVFFHKTERAWLRWMHFGISKNTPMAKKYIQYIYNFPRYKFWADNRVIKFIRANMMVSWLARNYPFPIVFVIRNPFDVIKSQINMGWGANLKRYMRQEKLRSIFMDNNTLRYIDQLSTLTEKLAAKWCIENTIAIKQISEQKSDNRIIPVTYESIKDNDHVVKLLRVLGYTESEIKTINKICKLRERIHSTKRKSTGSVGLTGNQRELIDNVLKNLGVGSYAEITKNFNKSLIY